VSATAAIYLGVFLPLAGAVLIRLAGAWPNLREMVTLITAGLLFLAVLSLVPDVMAGARPAASLLDVAPDLSIAFEVEPLGMLFALVASGLWIVTSIYAIGYMRGHHEQNQTRFYICFAIALSSAVGVAFAGNLLTLFIFYEVLTLSTYPLVTHAGDDEARQGGRVYLGILLFTSITFLLTATIWTWSLSGTLDFTPGGVLQGKASPGIAGVLLLLYAFGIGKAALMPFHRWLPAAMVAPTPVSALLHAVAVVKAGVFSVLKVAVYIFGIDLVAELASGRWVMYIAAATILIGSLVAMRQDNLKRRLAYSTVSQLSYIVLGAMMGNGLGIIGGGMHIATHAFGKITLFFCAGAIMVASHKTEVSEMGGIGRTMPLTTTAFLLASLSIIGLPPFGGLWSKWYLALGALDANDIALVAVLMISSLLNIAYLLPIPLRGFFSPPSADRADGHGHGETAERFGPRIAQWREAPWPCLLAIVLTTIGCVVLFFEPQRLFDLLEPIIRP